MKKSLRQTALAYRNELQPEEIKALSQEISASLSTLLQTFQPCTVGLFYPTRREPNVLEIMNDLALKGFHWALPVCCESPTGAFLKFAQFAPNDELEPGRYDIPVPKFKSWVQPDVLLIPCLAFHRAGARLGYGAGWYDRTLSQMPEKPVTVGVAYALTEFQDNFSEQHDELLDYVLTERELIFSHSGTS
ncbi:5-formyltetrahydrofolate cyclo-ligase [Limnobacter sp.]|uniref:5-formyltetrahydrofolate cyclo-ligase n=1 Tax=Limnobacter sp. TaxID=2003368 RepID=UPI0027BA7F07|nr:5-formyltetrahydrofolate cyclo-ligase [Limnobacter sp.]